MKKVISLVSALMLFGCSEHNPFEPEFPNIIGGGSIGGNTKSSTSIFAKPHSIAKDLQLEYESWSHNGEEKDTITVYLDKVEGNTAYFSEGGYIFIAQIDSNGMNFNEFSVTIEGDYAHFKGHSRLFSHFVSGKDSLFLGTPTNEIEKYNVTDNFMLMNPLEIDTYSNVDTTTVNQKAYESLSLYYDPTPTYYDGAGVALFYNRNEGFIGSQYFGHNFVEYYAGGYTLISD